MNYDYRKLKGRIVEIYGTQKAFASAMGWSERTLSLKINGERYWKQPDISKACTLLKIQGEDVEIFFFSQMFNKIEQKAG